VKPQHALLIVSAALVAVSACSSKPSSSTGSGAAGTGGVKELGTLALESKPQARVYIDDAPRGMTPLRLDLPAGPHRVRLEANSKARTLTVGVVAGAEVTQSVDLDRAVQTGSLFVRSDPAGAKVLVDNKPAGVTPITVLDLTPGPHAISVTGKDGANARQSVQVEAGATATLRLSLERPQVAEASTAVVAEPTNGWVLVDAPIEMQVLHGGRQLGVSGRRLALAPGSYDLQLRAADYTSVKRVDVSAGRVARIEVNVPDGTVNLNAAPWAEVYLDGRSLGETPIANASVTAGTHEVIFRNPQFNELRQMVTVASGKATRLAVTLTKK
jgi:hypothetical protein